MERVSETTQKELFSTEKVKVLISDLDNTLRQGILDEKKDGETVILNKNYYEYIKDLHDRGIQIFIASKNSKDEVLKQFKQLHIDPNIFTKVIANREPKYLNIKNLLHQLEGVKPEQVIFVDDNQLEREEVEKAIPNIHTIDYLDRELLKKIPYLAWLQVQSETRVEERKNSYRTWLIDNLEINNNEDQDFLKSLGRKLSLSEINPKDSDAFKRVINLLYTTHQINFNPGKFWKEDEALNYLTKKINEGYLVYAMWAEESGLLLWIGGAYIVNIQNNYATIEDTTTSCSILGRWFENKAMIELVLQLKDKWIQNVDALVKPSSSNKRVQALLQELWFIQKEKKGEIIVYSLKTNDFIAPQKYDYIQISDREISQERSIIPSVMTFFDKEIKPILQEENIVINIGSARGEVLGFLRPEKKKAFEDIITQKNITYKKIDLDPPSEEPDTIKANAEDLSEIIKSASCDMVIATELLEHTENPRKIINEMIRVSKVWWFLFISVPCFLYPKHEYPIDLRRIWPKTLLSFFPEPEFKIIKMEEESRLWNKPMRIILLIQKEKHFDVNYQQPEWGHRDTESGITYYE